MFYCSFVSIHYIICECGDTFPTEEALKEHLERDHNPKVEKHEEFRCDTCNKVFTTERACLVHQRVHTLVRHRTREPREPREPREARETRDPRDPTQKRTRRNYNYKNIVCEVCGKRYASAAALRYHQRIHTGERPYQCTMCPKTFTMPLFLQIHTRTHTGERPFECPHCPKAFSNKAALLRHDRVHTGVKPYPCPQCGKTFTQSNSMKLHVHTVHLKLPTPYKSKSRRMKAAANNAMKVEVQVESGVFKQDGFKQESFDQEGFKQEIKPEEEEYLEGNELDEADAYEVQAEFYSEEGEEYQEVYEGDVVEEDLYLEEVVENPEVALYEIEKPEVLYEEVYEED